MTKLAPAIRRLLLPVLVFVTAGLIHYLWLGLFPERDPAQARWQTVPTSENASWFSRYVETQSYWMGYSYALPLAFAAIALRRYRECRAQRLCAARNVAIGDVTLSGIVAAAGCFLTGCCGSPMLAVYLSFFGASFLPLVKPLIAGMTTVMVSLSYYWWIWRRIQNDAASAQPTACAAGEACGCLPPTDTKTNPGSLSR
ncbi:MAG: hypothetical protein ABS95_00895 [Verrucomicrobia bacterium SCN 57-15]|nr:MAG: hypothetical protein ABS95_00895 [Verrucomicrobia bacterium SCN 57-15]